LGFKEVNVKEEKVVYETDASQVPGKAKDVLQPKTIGEIRTFVSGNHKICIRGGGTGLVGGAVPQDEVVLDLSLLDKIDNLDVNRRTIEVEAGVILDDLNDYLAQFDLEFPINPSSHSVCTLGGMIATNAVGSRAIKYGKTSEWINWLDIVNPSGEIERKAKTELSDFVGMEGITGVIAKASLRLTEKPKIFTGDIVVRDYIDEIVNIVRDLKRNPNVSLIEFLDKRVSEMVGLPFKYHLIIEYESDEGKIKGEEFDKLLAIRDKVYPMLAEKGYTRIEDPKILLDRFTKLFNYLESYSIPVFGHLSVGILHPCFTKEQEKLIPEIMQLTKRLSGQITGEHGVGLLKKEFVDVNDKKLLVVIKNRLDPTNKFNSGKVL
jgi:FAD/FMN-containing dehydrogenase